jgi:hypothetical protein
LSNVKSIKVLALFSSTILLLGLMLSGHTANAASCRPISTNTKTMGSMIADGISTVVKSASYPAGGVFDPPESPLAIGLSTRHQPLSASEGSSLLVWHVNYNGCQGKINFITKKKVGYKFTMIDELANLREYQISSIQTVPVKKYKAEWFRLSGQRQLVFVTCAGKVVKGHHTQNLVIIATPV